MGIPSVSFSKYAPPSSYPEGSATDPTLLGGDLNLIPAQAGEGESQIAQQQKPPAQPRRPAPVAPPPIKPQPTGEEITREHEAQRDQALRAVYERQQKDARQGQWDQITGQGPVPVFLGGRVQQPLPQDWRSTVSKIEPRYLQWTEEAARRRGIPVELLARHLYRESNYNVSANIDPETGLPIRHKDGSGKAGGIAQLFPQALADVGVVADKNFWSDPRKQIEAGAAYLALLRRQYGDWPKAVAAYHFGRTRFGEWLAGRTPDFEDKAQRGANEGLWRQNTALRSARENRFKEELDQFQEMTRHLPYVFLGNPRRYD